VRAERLSACEPRRRLADETIHRRTLLKSLTGGLLAGPLVAGSLALPSAAQGQAGKIWRIGFLREGPNEKPNPAELSAQFLGALGDLGYVEGRNLVIEYRYAGNRPEQIPGFASELVGLKVDVIVAMGTQETIAAKAATTTIPIVMLGVGDHVGAGLVTNLTHPESNVTGTSLMVPDLGGKRLELLREIVPRLQRVAILGNPRNASAAAELRAAERAARSLGLAVYFLGIDSVSRLDVALADVGRDRPDGLLVLQDALTFAHRREIAAAALRIRLPSVLPTALYVGSGGLISYGYEPRAFAGRAASYVDRILKGAKPADLPIEQPTKFELVINRKTAQTLGLTIAPSLLLRIDRIIE
jgi:putative ABC transport system substrate-binding protein